MPEVPTPSEESEESEESEVLQDTPHRRVERVGNTVRRPTHPWSPAVHALLGHLAEVAFPYAPRLLGVDAEGREILEHLEGDSGQDGWSRIVDEDGLRAFARLLRDYHRAVADFRPSADLAWCTGVATLRPGEIVCHGDFGPWNVVWRGRRPVGLIDWDYARPAAPLHDIAYALEYAAPFRDDAECLRWLRYAEPPDRRRRIAVFAEGYGLPGTAGLVDAVIAVQEETVALVGRLADQGRQPQVAWVAEGHLDELRARAAWSRAHRRLLE
ncbi:phosphotransferase [Streptomyces sp. 3MP-14]|uniref:Phosphotransferase n=2 Tax=Streptomyces TaxID=1883 RepID=A0A5N6AGL0_9ACTN|nr:phosphotransferase [Streptomyces mimosae]KAB8177709.1 phosphotransferase [Streptomyces sp. 3MP-14]